MKRHAALPDSEYLQGIGKVEPKVVKETVSHPGTKNQTYDTVGKEIFDLGFVQIIVTVLGYLHHNNVGEDKTEDIHQTVPPQLHRADMYQYWINHGIVHVLCASHTRYTQVKNLNRHWDIGCFFSDCEMYGSDIAGIS